MFRFSPNAPFLCELRALTDPSVSLTSMGRAQQQYHKMMSSLLSHTCNTCISLTLYLPYSFSCQPSYQLNQNLSGEKTQNKIINSDGKWTCQLSSILSIMKPFHSTAVMARQDFFSSFIYEICHPELRH